MAESVLASINTINKQLQGLTLTRITPVGKELGSGSYGKVFTVKYGGKTYAAKEIHSLLLEVANPEEKRTLRDNFLKECYHCSTLRHPKIVQFIGVYYPPQSFLPVMVMELMDVSLKDYVKTPNISMKLKVSILYDISQGLNFLHCHTPPIIHRDLSPNNVLLSHESVAKISDLGLAKVVKAGTKGTKSKLTKAPGTADFMSPEALTDDPTYSTGLDIFSYGGLILHVVNQEWPTPTSLIEYDSKMNPVKVLTEVKRRQKYLDMMTGEAEVLKSLVIRCLDNDPANRPTATNVLEILKELKIQQGHTVINTVINNDNQTTLSTHLDSHRLNYALLLEEMYGRRYLTVGKLSAYDPKIVKKGSLLKAVSLEECSNVVRKSGFAFNYKVMDDYDIRLQCNTVQIHHLTFHQMQLLQAVEHLQDRVEVLHKLEWVERLRDGIGIYVTIPTYPHPIKGIIKQCGKLPDKIGINFEVKLIGSDGNRDIEKFKHQVVIVSIDKITGFSSADAAVVKKSSYAQPDLSQKCGFKSRDRVLVRRKDNKFMQGTVKYVGNHAEHGPIIGIELDQNIHPSFVPGNIAGLDALFVTRYNATKVFLPLSAVLSVHDKSIPIRHCVRVHSYEPIPVSAEESQINPNRETLSTLTIRDENPYNLEIGSMIELSKPPLYGVIKWIGYLESEKYKIAGVEMDKVLPGGHDGTWKDTHYFMSQKGRGLFLPLSKLRADQRFVIKKEQQENPLGRFDINNSIKSITFIQPPETIIENLHTGSGKGIQGHHNSCYIDSTLYGLFAFSGAFDDLFFKEVTDQFGIAIKSAVQSIVNTLRHNNVVLYNHIMILRNELDKLQQMKGLECVEKDPENFLTVLFIHALNIEAFLRIKRPSGTDKEFFVQLFVEGNKHQIPNTQDLLTKMFIEQQISFTKYPVRLLLQIPHLGKRFKAFRGVIPSLELDLTTLCEQYAGKCMVCGKQGTQFCPDCEKQYFCKECAILWHIHEDRRYHKLVSRQSSNDGGDPGRLRLLSVLCIGFSHYVCFTRVQGSGTNEWVFFDSMAERPDDVHNIPRVIQCTQQLNEWVYGAKDLTNYTSKELPELVQRFVEDVYMCIYVDQDGIMYGDDDDDDGTP